MNDDRLERLRVAIVRSSLEKLLRQIEDLLPQTRETIFGDTASLIEASHDIAADWLVRVSEAPDTPPEATQKPVEASL